MMRKRYTPTFKAQVVRELLKEEKTLAQVAAEYGIHPSQLISRYLAFYNHERPHQALGYQTPAEVYLYANV